MEARVAWIGAKIRAIRWKFPWGILQSSRALLQTSGHVSGSIVRGPAVVVLVIKIIVDYSFGNGIFSPQYVTCVIEEVFERHECFLWKWMPFFWRKSNILENVAASVVLLWYYQWGAKSEHHHQLGGTNSCGTSGNISHASFIFGVCQCNPAIFVPCRSSVKGFAPLFFKVIRQISRLHG